MEKRNRGLSELLGRINWEEEGASGPTLLSSSPCRALEHPVTFERFGIRCSREGFRRAYMQRFLDRAFSKSPA